MPQDLYLLYQAYAPLLWLGLFILSFLLFIWLLLLQRRQRSLARRLEGLKEGFLDHDLPERVKESLEEVRQATLRAEQLVDSFEETGRRLERTVQKVGIVRFDAFPDVGGEQSFAIALLDAHGDGVVISSIRSRTENRIYAKPLRRWDSAYALSEEEKEAIAKAYMRR